LDHKTLSSCAPRTCSNLFYYRHLPATLLASFVKRLSRLSLNAPPSAIITIIPFTYNILRRHPALMIMIHRSEDVDGSEMGIVSYRQRLNISHSSSLLNVLRSICCGRTKPKSYPCTRVLSLGALLAQKPLLLPCINLGTHLRGGVYETWILAGRFSRSYIWHGKV
jgi:hypothetical protein